MNQPELRDANLISRLFIRQVISQRGGDYYQTAESSLTPEPVFETLSSASGWWLDRSLSFLLSGCARE